MSTERSSADQPWPAARVGWFAVIVLAIANAVSFIDRLVISLLVPDIKAELGLSDTQIALLTGIAFAFFYATLGLPIARLADTKSRKVIITVGVAFWSLMTAVCGLAKGFWHLFLARVGVGCGEATLSPSTYSMLADFFPPHKLATPIGVFSAGISAGMGLAFIAGAAAIQLVAGLGDVHIPLIGVLGGWRLVFVIVGSLGVFVVLLMLLVREPPRRHVGKDEVASAVPLEQVFAHLRSNWKIYTLTMSGYGFTAVSVYGIISWTPVFYIRTFGLSPTEAGYLVGMVAMTGGILGAYVGGAIADRWSRTDPNAKLKVLTICCVGLLPAGVISPLLPSVELALGVLFFTFFFGTAAAGPTGSFIQIITPGAMRAQFGALYQFALNFVGLGLGTVIVALFTDYPVQGRGYGALFDFGGCCVSEPAGPHTVLDGLAPLSNATGRGAHRRLASTLLGRWACREVVRVRPRRGEATDLCVKITLPLSRLFRGIRHEFPVARREMGILQVRAGMPPSRENVNKDF